MIQEFAQFIWGLAIGMIAGYLIFGKISTFKSKRSFQQVIEEEIKYRLRERGFHVSFKNYSIIMRKNELYPEMTIYMLVEKFDYLLDRE